jgi:hypothetical protein
VSARTRRRRGAALLLALACAAAVWAAPAARAQEEPDPRLPAPRLPAGYSLVEGDVLVRTEELGKPNPGRFSTFQADRLWPGGVVPYACDTSVTNHADRLAQVQGAMALLVSGRWGSLIQFVPRTSESDYIYYVADTSSNFSPVGRQGGRQEIHVVSWSQLFVVCHETMHALGFWHEQSRGDRDTYVTIHPENICSFCCNGGSCAYNFQKESGSGAYGPYDFDSIMHYSKCAFLSPSLFCPGNYTIEVNAPYAAWQDLIGQRNHLSRMDRVSLSFLYALGNWRFVDGNAGGPGAGAFLDPWPDFATGVWNTPSGGTLYVQPGSYAAPISGLSTPMRIEAPLGSVQLTAGPSLAARVRRP